MLLSSLLPSAVVFAEEAGSDSVVQTSNAEVSVAEGSVGALPSEIPAGVTAAQAQSEVPTVEAAPAPVVSEPVSDAIQIDSTSAPAEMRAPVEQRIESFYGSKGALYVVGIVVPSPDGKGFVFDKEATVNYSAFASLSEAIQNNFKKLGEHIIFEIDGKLVLFTFTDKKVYINESSSNLANAFK